MGCYSPYSKGLSPFRLSLWSKVTLSGIGLHGGAKTSATLTPAEVGTGIQFRRKDRKHAPLVEALWSNVVPSDLCTTLGYEGQPYVGTVEHLMAALAGMGISDLVIEVDGPELPMLDGSSIAWVDAILAGNLKPMKICQDYLVVTRPVRVDRPDGAWAMFSPGARRRVSMELDFRHPAIGRQRHSFTYGPHEFMAEIARARSFGFMDEMEKLQERGLCLGASLDNAIGIGKHGVENPEGLRYCDEYARHKALDAVGDLALAGAPVLGEFSSYKGGHALTHALLCKLMAMENTRFWARGPEAVYGRAPAFTQAAE